MMQGLELMESQDRAGSLGPPAMRWLLILITIDKMVMFE